MTRTYIYNKDNILKNIEIEHPKHEVRVDYENTLNDDFSVFITKDILNRDILLNVGINVYKRDVSGSNKKLCAIGIIKINNLGVIECENR